MSGAGRRQQAMAQCEWGWEEQRREHAGARSAVDAECFADPDRVDLFLGNQRIDRYLSARGQALAVRLRTLLRNLDYGLFAHGYSRHGRKAIHPCNLLGLIVYATLKGHNSLREMEELAQTELGAMWLCGGHMPDHSTIGKFIQLHGEILSADFYTALVKTLLGRLGVHPGVVAADGTVVEAAASRFGLVKLEAAQQAAVAARAAALSAPEDPELAQRASAAARVSEHAVARSMRRQQQGAAADKTVVAPGEPEAVVQPLKSGAVRPAYKPSLAVHESGLIVGQHVDPSSERAAVLPMLKQHQASFAGLPTRLLLDAGYPSLALLRQLYELELDVLVPSGPTRAPGWQRRGRDGRFAKAEFRYAPERDVYRCPAGRELVAVGRARRDHTGSYQRYRGRQCAGCELRPRCTSAAQGRALNRYLDDELKEAMAAVLAQPAARRAYRQRTMVERAIAQLRQHGLRRFRRRGLKSVRVEFALHCIAYNLGLTVAGGHWHICVLLLARFARPQTTWQLIAAITLTT